MKTMVRKREKISNLTIKYFQEDFLVSPIIEFYWIIETFVGSKLSEKREFHPCVKQQWNEIWKWKSKMSIMGQCHPILNLFFNQKLYLGSLCRGLNGFANLFAFAKFTCPLYRREFLFSFIKNGKRSTIWTRFKTCMSV